MGKGSSDTQKVIVRIDPGGTPVSRGKFLLFRGRLGKIFKAVFKGKNWENRKIIMFTGMYKARGSGMWKRLVEKPVENVENL